MSSQMYIRPRGRGAPFACKVSVSTGGSNHINGAGCYHIGAWYSREEYDFTNFVPMNFRWFYAGASLADSAVTESGIHNITTAPGSSLAFSWSKPRWRQPDHYSIYKQTGAAWSFSALSLKILPSSGLVNGNIPGNATSALILDGSSRTQNLIVPVVAVHATGVTIPGNRGMSFQLGTSTVSLTAMSGGVANGTYVVDDVDVNWTADGPVTKLTLQGVSSVTPAANSGRCSYTNGPFVNRLSAAGGYRPLTFINTGLDRNISLTGVDPTEADAFGWQQPQSFIQGHPFRRIDFEVAMQGLGPAAAHSTAPGLNPGGMSRLMTWAREGVEVELVDEEGWSSNQFFASPSMIRYFGTLTLPGHPGTTHNWDGGEGHRFSMKLHGYKRADDDRGNYAITVVASGAGGAFEISGDLTWLFVAGLGFYVSGSTGNDKSYCVASSSYSTANNRTTITITTTVPSAVADGYIEVQDW